jgi:hypothetical protein
MSEEPRALLFVPPLVVVLRMLEEEHGRPLTESEVLAARDQAACIAVPAAAIHQMAESRGYADLDPEHVWQEWQALRFD